MSYEKFYPNGWQSGETGGTPITPEALNHIEKGIKQTYSDFAPAVESAEYPGCYYRTVNGEVEWLNPPMVPGVEYRTTERFSGKPVYVQAVNFGAMPNNTEKLVSYTTPSGYVSAAIDVWGHTSNGLTLPYESDYASFTIYASVDAVGMTTKSDQSGKTAVLVVKYCKE